MEPESSLPYSQVPATCPHPEPARIRHYCGEFEISAAESFGLGFLGLWHYVGVVTDTSDEPAASIFRVTITLMSILSIKQPL
jgi:hypothetical protein